MHNYKKTLSHIINYPHVCKASLMTAKVIETSL